MNTLPNMPTATLPVGMLLIVFYFTFTLGSIAGANAAVNDSIDTTELKDNLSTVSERTEEDIRENHTSPVDDVVLAVAKPVAQGAETVGIWGIGFGHRNPTLARYHGQASPFISIAGLGVALIYNLRRLLN